MCAAFLGELEVIGRCSAVTRRTTWIMNLFTFECGDEIRVSLFGQNFMSVLRGDLVYKID